MDNQGGLHEGISHSPIKRSSDRNFGLVFAAFFAVLAGAAAWRGHLPTAAVWAALAALSLLVALLVPTLLAAPNRLWYQFGLLLGRVVNPLVMLAVFVVAVTPTGLVLRAMGKDLLRLKWQRSASTYWIPRDPPGPAPKTMKYQF